MCLLGTRLVLVISSPTQTKNSFRNLLASKIARLPLESWEQVSQKKKKVFLSYIFNFHPE